jgi:hypothetical protein
MKMARALLDEISSGKPANPSETVSLDAASERR